MHLQAGISADIAVDADGIIKDESWRAAQKMMSYPQKLLQNLQSVKRSIDSGMMPRMNVEKARRIPQQLGEDFSHEAMMKKSAAAASLCNWTSSVIQYYDAVAAVEA